MGDPFGPPPDGAEASVEESTEAEDSCLLLTTSCTTGWFDWAHGRLWLCSAGLLRESTGLSTTIARRGRPEPIDPAGRQTRLFSRADRDHVVDAGAQNVWIAWSDVARATLKRGIVDHSLHLERVDRTRAKLLWLRDDSGFDLLALALGEALGDRFRVQNRPIG
jgi:hypothetical protein